MSYSNFVFLNYVTNLSLSLSLKDLLSLWSNGNSYKEWFLGYFHFGLPKSTDLVFASPFFLLSSNSFYDLAFINNSYSVLLLSFLILSNISDI